LANFITSKFQFERLFIYDCAEGGKERVELRSRIDFVARRAGVGVWDFRATGVPRS